MHNTYITLLLYSYVSCSCREDLIFLGCFLFLVGGLEQLHFTPPPPPPFKGRLNNPVTRSITFPFITFFRSRGILRFNSVQRGVLVSGKFGSDCLLEVMWCLNLSIYR